MPEPTRMLELMGQHLELLPEGAVFWHEEQMLIIADAHLGKVNHFRKSGIPVPGQAGLRSMEKLQSLMMGYAPETILFLGDLFHSKLNKDWEQFGKWRMANKNARIILVQGNHDILPVNYYLDAELHLALDEYVRPPFLFRHEPSNIPHHRFYTLAGHIHPAVRLRGKGKQSLKLSCFLFGRWQGLLPAFGEFTGSALVKPLPDDLVFVLSGTEVFKAEA